MYNLIMTGIFSALNLTTLTIAYQNDKSATVSLLAYIALVYAFAADVMIFDYTFVFLELLGSAIITFFNLFTIIYKMRFDEDDSVLQEVKPLRSSEDENEDMYNKALHSRQYQTF